MIDLPADYTAGRIGVDYSPEQIESCLREIGCSVERAESGYAVTVPSWRTDLRAKEDLTEEIARMTVTRTSPRLCRWLLRAAVTLRSRRVSVVR